LADTHKNAAGGSPAYFQIIFLMFVVVIYFNCNLYWIQYFTIVCCLLR